MGKSALVDGYGYGYGDGSGYGDGYGDDYGYGYGSGYGYGDGSGYGYGDDEYWKATIAAYVERVPAIVRAYANQMAASGATLALWRSDEEGRPCNGGSGTKAHAGLRETVPGPLAICTPNALHATYQPHKYTGSRLWLVALFGEVQEQDDKLAALEREIIAEIV